MSQISSFLNSGFFSSLVTILTGLLIIAVYLLQKRSEKSSAARILLMEIRNAEEKVDIINEKLNSNATEDLPSVLPTNNWSRYSYLFAKDFDQDELRSINHFYSACEMIQDFATKNNNFFWTTTEERARVIQQKLADVVEKASLTENSAQEIATAKDLFLNVFANDGYVYAPKKPLSGMEFHIKNLQKISATSAGSKLKRIGKLV